MTLTEFRSRVRHQFGPNLEHMTPANVREFLDALQRPEGGAGGRIHLDEAKTSYEAILRDFFRRTLESSPEEATISLWTLALELAYADLRDVVADQMGSLFAGIEDPQGR